MPPIAQNTRRSIPVRAGQWLKVTAGTINSGVIARLRLRFAQWTLNPTASPLSIVDAITPVVHTMTSGSTIYVRPFPGFVALEAYLDSSGSEQTNVALTVEEVVPTRYVDAEDWETIDLASLRWRTANASDLFFGARLDSVFRRTFLESFTVERSANGVYRCQAPWMDELAAILRTQPSGSVTIGGQSYTLCYVLPSAAGAWDTNPPGPDNQGNSFAAPRITIPNVASLSVPTCLVLEAGHLFTELDGLKANVAAVNLIIVSSVPEQPAFLSNFIVHDTNLPRSTSSSTGFWPENAPFVASFPTATEPSLVVYEPAISYQDPDTSSPNIIYTSPRPGMVPFKAQTGTPAWAEYSLSFDSGNVRFTEYDTEGPPTITFMQDGSKGGNVRLSTSVGVKLYMMDIESLGTARPLDAYMNGGARHEIRARDCAFRFAANKISTTGALSATPCVRIEGAVDAYFSRCEISEGLSDGLDARGTKYGTSPVVKLSPYILEDRCVMQHCGLHPADPTQKNNQCSTMHDGSYAIRIGSEYSITGGPSIQDVYLSGTQRSSYTAIVGCFTYWSICADQYTRQGLILGSGSGNVDESTAWLVELRFSDAFGTNARLAARKVVLLDATRVAFDAGFVVASSWTSSAEVVQRYSSTVSPSLTPPLDPRDHRESMQFVSSISTCSRRPWLCR